MDNIKKAILEMKEKHGSILTKETFASFALLKPHIDMLVSKIIMGSPVLSSNVEAIELYTPNNSDYKKTIEFLKTFQMEEDGYDDFMAVKLVRYVRFMQHLTTVLRLKVNFSIADMIDPKMQRMASLILSLSDYASLISKMTPNIKEVIASVVKDKAEQCEYLELYDKQEKFLLKDVSNYETLILVQDAYLVQYEEATAKSRMLSLELEEIRDDNSREDQQEYELKRSLEEGKAELKKHNEEISILRNKLVTSPDKIGVELVEVNKEIEKEKEKLAQYLASCSNLTAQLKKAKLIDPSMKIFLESVASVKKLSDKLTNIDTELASCDFSHKEQIDKLKKENERYLKSIESMILRIESSKKMTNLNKENSAEYKAKIDIIREMIDNERIKISNVNTSEVKRQIEETKEERGRLGEEYEVGLANLKDNFERGLKELLEFYQKL